MGELNLGCRSNTVIRTRLGGDCSTDVSRIHPYYIHASVPESEGELHVNVNVFHSKTASNTCIHNYYYCTPHQLLLQAHTIPTVVLHNYISRYCTTNPPRACLAHVSRSGPTSSWCLTVLLHLVCLANDIDVVWTSPSDRFSSRGSAIAVC
jgi:hypothetical protein